MFSPSEVVPRENLIFFSQCLIFPYAQRGSAHSAVIHKTGALGEDCWDREQSHSGQKMATSKNEAENDGQMVQMALPNDLQIVQNPPKMMSKVRVRTNLEQMRKFYLSGEGPTCILCMPVQSKHIFKGSHMTSKMTSKNLPKTFKNRSQIFKKLTPDTSKETLRKTSAKS